MASVSNLYIDQGSDFSVVVTLKNQDGTLLNLENFTVKSQFRKSYQSSQAVDFNIEILEPFATGKIRMTLPASVSSPLMAGRYLYDVEVTNLLGERRRALEGIIILTPEITRI